MSARDVPQHKLLIGLSLLVLALGIVSLMIGRNPLPLIEAAMEAFDDSASTAALILSEIRLPRALIAAIVGASLGLAGAVMQGMLRNPLASPGLVGSSSGAAFGAVMALYFGFEAVFALALPVGGMLGSLGAMGLVVLLAGRNAGVTTLILAGVAINSMALAMISLALNLAPSPYAMREMVMWMLGSVADRSMRDFWVLLGPTLLGWLLLAGSGRALDALTLGEDTAHTLGINIRRLRWRLFLGVSLTVGAAVSIAGSIAFIGLVVPHLLRPMVGHQPGRLLTVSALGGAALLLLADIGVRLFPAGTDIKVGVLTSLVGAPFFLYLILKTRRSSL